MAQTYFFYDVETSGTSPAFQRVMQFAGQRVDTELKPIGEPVNWLIRLTEDVLPEPEAILVHGITPQKTLQDGISEKELADRLIREIFTPDTVAIGFNNIRFDDEFIRHIFWRSFYDPYEWHWKAGRSRWDLLDATRMMRALRPGGLNWPLDAEGKPTNRLGDLARANQISTDNAHDALADVQCTLELARKIRTAQPKLFDYLLNLRDKRLVKELIESEEPFVYTSGRYSGEHLKTTVAIKLGSHPNEREAALVYDLRVHPTPFIDMSVSELAKLIYVPYAQRDKVPQLPVKKLAYTKAPSVAPMSTLDEASLKRINLDLKEVAAHREALQRAEGFAERVAQAFAGERPPRRTDPDGQLYDGFLNDKDRAQAQSVRTATPKQLAELKPDFVDKRLASLFLRYKARNFPTSLSDDERAAWEGWREAKLIKGADNSLTLSVFGGRLDRLVTLPNLSEQNRYLLEEVKLYAESIAPASLL